tara:strand:- start:1488 stop:1898 length:411 start_codon:yes stop_codon:yes gene_type:complete
MPNNNTKKGENMTTLIKSINKLRVEGIINIALASTLMKRANKKQMQAVRDERQSRVNQTVAFYIGSNWQKGQGYRVKAAENAVSKYGITRRELEVAMKTLYTKELLTHNKDQVKNNCHVQWSLPVTEDDAPVFGSN